MKNVSFPNLIGKSLGLRLLAIVKTRTLALGHVLRYWFSKEDERLVAFYYEGNPSIIKNGLPYVRMYTCYENAIGKRRVVESGALRPKHRGLQIALREWKNRKAVILTVPSYADILGGKQFEGAGRWALLSESFPIKRKR